MLSVETFQEMRERFEIGWEWFLVRDLGNGLVGLWNPVTKRWLRVTCENGDGKVDSPSQGDAFLDWWTAEFFQLCDAGNGDVGVYSPFTQRWLGTGPIGSQHQRKAVAIRSAASIPSAGDPGSVWERFRVEEAGLKVCLQALGARTASELISMTTHEARNTVIAELASRKVVTPHCLNALSDVELERQCADFFCSAAMAEEAAAKAEEEAAAKAVAEKKKLEEKAAAEAAAAKAAEEKACAKAVEADATAAAVAAERARAEEEKAAAMAAAAEQLRQEMESSRAEAETQVAALRSELQASRAEAENRVTETDALNKGLAAAHATVDQLRGKLEEAEESVREFTTALAEAIFRQFHRVCSFALTNLDLNLGGAPHIGARGL
eukprot:596301-Prymnesium_polylepis.1